MKHVLLVHDLMQSIIRCLLAFSPFYLSSSLSGPWPEAFIRATTQSSGITNILSRSGERKVRLLLPDCYWQSEWSLNPTRSQGHGDGSLEDTTYTHTQPLRCRLCFCFYPFNFFYWFYLWAKRWSGSWTAFPCRLDNSFPQKLCFTEPTLNISSVTTITVAANEQGKGVWYYDGL